MTISVNETPVTLQRLAIVGEISGNIAENTAETAFFNPNARVLEGALEFPLLEGRQIIGFALDIDWVICSGLRFKKQRNGRFLKKSEVSKLMLAAGRWRSNW